MEQRLLQEPVQLRLGADEEPGGRASVETEGGRGRRHDPGCPRPGQAPRADRKSTRLNSSHGYISYAVFCLKKKTEAHPGQPPVPNPGTGPRICTDSGPPTALP